MEGYFAKLHKTVHGCCIIFTEGYFGLRRMLRSGLVHLRRPSHFSNLSSFHSEGYRSGQNEAVLKTVCRQARGFESHSLRQKIHRFAVDFFIQSAGLVWHQRTCALYGIATKSRMASRESRIKACSPVAWCHTRRCRDSIQPFGLIPYRNKLRIPYKASPWFIYDSVI